ncbi:MAG: hypothetical protein V3T72_13375 [Thermoanaerobaculia bacterium]
MRKLGCIAAIILVGILLWLAELEVCTLLASRLDALYEARYGVRPRGEPAEAIVLFAEIDDYRSFSKQQQIALGYAGYALGARGLAVFYAGDQSLDGFLPTLGAGGSVSELPRRDRAGLDL